MTTRRLFHASLWVVVIALTATFSSAEMRDPESGLIVAARLQFLVAVRLAIRSSALREPAIRRPD